MKSFSRLCGVVLVFISLVLGGNATASYSAPSLHQQKKDVKAFQKLEQHIHEASKKTGLSAEFITAIISIESSMGRDTYGRYSSVKGVMQYTDRTWRSDRAKYAKKLGLPANVSVNNNRANILIGAAALADNKKYLERVSGKKVTPGDMYLTHFVGLYGAANLLKGKPNASINKYIKLHKGNGNSYYVNGRVATVDQFREKMNARVGIHVQRYAEYIKKPNKPVRVITDEPFIPFDGTLASIDNMKVATRLVAGNILQTTLHYVGNQTVSRFNI